MNNTDRLAIESIKREIQRISVDANLYDMYSATFPYAKRASDKKKRLEAAIKDIEAKYGQDH